MIICQALSPAAVCQLKLALFAFWSLSAKTGLLPFVAWHTGWRSYLRVHATCWTLENVSASKAVPRCQIEGSKELCQEPLPSVLFYFQLRGTKLAPPEEIKYTHASRQLQELQELQELFNPRSDGMSSRTNGVQRAINYDELSQHKDQ